MQQFHSTRPHHEVAASLTIPGDAPERWGALVAAAGRLDVLLSNLGKVAVSLVVSTLLLPLLLIAKFLKPFSARESLEGHDSNS